MPIPALRTRVVIVSPALADANNGNWQTARRWQQMLAPHAVRIVREWPDAAASAQDQVLLALHARRSAASIAAWSAAHGPAGLGVVLTGTDLYRDIHNNDAARQSLALAQRLVVLQDLGPEALPAPLRPKVRVIFQSTTARQTLVKSPRFLRALMVGHLRDEKSPQTLFEAARLLAGEPTLLIDHIGEGLDPELGEQARATAAACPNYRWLGGQVHEATRRRIQRAHVLVHTSRMEGGAHVIMEAVRSGTPVVASRIAGNVGMLGKDYAGYFEWGDAAALAALLQRCHDSPGPQGLLARLGAQCARRAPLFDPAAERSALLQLVQELLPASADTPPDLPGNH
ncbi:MAG: selenoneine biosynthesis selenosugar synthase SenB [Polaromonas sp.]|uniref:selenoneine biosynthesis selenosugar synthase SenB n=1 Tax=Polaromonas sp. TaxID=1869339 RepID=UPI00272F7F11|nr:selenoneine biosynthesis selenosugar synthase SenB [Polaromonas sp.]MDP1743137.1 selenoneine biosynthesis selenosugar synthase SenB [Polaromonas sp.]MDP3354489.1 selenoneine biosynthesis selenosugar synthase SenB [Polaromonas sp.]